MSPKKQETDAERLDRWKRQAEECAKRKYDAMKLVHEHGDVPCGVPGDVIVDAAELTWALMRAYQRGHADGRKEVGK